ncbi:sugar ABC transporter permease [Diaminobutyricibacter tongyongensis]|uniref:Sugar ABC transporter permease n=1 Tax=Leifsonia tongyongensis TaxID=1268043 RepID=A0A6L9XXC6_9MICO|nr:sugar ABC transporter permease [Diaminobutyricibacter tongyongensis]NEN05668.1 sugar ABC transporter permease [Diaminobutyricibacter tongyongensis]
MTMQTEVVPTTADSGATQTPQRDRKPYHVRLGSWWWALPALVLMVIVIYVTTIAGGFFAFTNWSGLGSFDFVGIQNFVKIFKTPELVGSLWNTLFLAFGFLIFTNVFGLLFALALNRGLKSRYVLRTLVFMPVVIAPIAVSYIWKFIFDYNGPLNQLMTGIGLPKQNWLASPTLAIWCVLIVMVWQNIGFVMVIYLAGLATVPVELEEAAAIDGANPFRRFRFVVLPLIRPSVAIATTLTLIQGLRVFDQVVALTGGGPAGATQTLALEVYQTAFTYQEFGFGAALALVLSLLILIFSIAQQWATRERSNQEA